MSSLRGADGVDDSAVKFLLRVVLKKKEEEKEKERKAREEKHERRMLALNHQVGEGLSLTDAEWSAWRKWATSSSSSARKRRKRKKRRKKAPKTSSSRSSGARIRRCGHGCALSPWFGAHMFIAVLQMWPRMSSTVAVVCAWLVFLVSLPSLCSFLLSSGPR